MKLIDNTLGALLLIIPIVAIVYVNKRRCPKCRKWFGLSAYQPVGFGVSLDEESKRVSCNNCDYDAAISG
jgi:hypothetical protein